MEGIKTLAEYLKMRISNCDRGFNYETCEKDTDKYALKIVREEFKYKV
jgi:hypothetical protein